MSTRRPSKKYFLPPSVHWVFTGAIIGRLALPAGSFRIGVLYLMPVHVGWLGLLILSLVCLKRKLRGRETAVWNLCAGLVASEMFPEMFRTGVGGDHLSILAVWRYSAV